MITVGFDEELLTKVVEAAVQRATEHLQKQNELPPFLTITELMDLLRIGRTKASELLNRKDFPVFREAGVLIPTHLLFQWIEKHTQWTEENTGFYSKDKRVI